MANRSRPDRRSSGLIAACDLAAAVLLALAGAGLGVVAATGTAGPFGIAFVVPALLGLLGLVPLLVGIVMRAAGQGSQRRTGRLAASAAVFLALAVVALPVGDVARVRIDDRRAEAARRRLDAAARSCARTADFAKCMRTADPAVGCTPSGCFITLVQLTHARRRTILIDVDGHARLISDED